MIIHCFIVTMVCINLGNSLESTRNQSPSEERFNFFDAELLQVFGQKKDANILISPVSIKLILGMLMEGAADKTADEIRTALRLPDDEGTRRKEFNTWLSVLQMEKSSNILKIANRMFMSNRFVVNPDYEETLKKFYSGGVTSVNFEKAKETSQLINNWISNQTSQLITGIVEEGQIGPENSLMLASAVYFKGFWSNPFASERTATRCFYSNKNKCSDSLMMMETGYFNFGYINRLDAKAIVLPYKEEKFSMLLLLPAKAGGLELLERDLVHVSLTSILSELKEQEVFVQIPQFEISYNVDLVESLKNVQIFEVFGKKANLSKMFTTDLESAAVSQIYHSAKIIVNEEGSEAAAATGALFVPLMGGTTTSFVANHPFLFFVINSDKNLILFAGKIIFPQISDASKKLIHTFKPHNLSSKKTQNLQRSLTNPSFPSKSGTAQTKSSAELTKTNDSFNGSFQKLEHYPRGQQSGPKFRSIKPTFSESRISSSNKNQIDNESPNSFGSSLLQSPFHRTLASHSAGFFEKGTQPLEKQGKSAQEISKNRKRQEPPSDDWRHHVLFFT